jgi:hypothetical protein
MQISRHWRMNQQRYRLVGVRYENGEADIQARIQLNDEIETQEILVEVDVNQEQVITAA